MTYIEIENYKINTEKILYLKDSFDIMNGIGGFIFFENNVVIRLNMVSYREFCTMLKTLKTTD